MDIAALSVVTSQAQVKSDAGIALMDNIMDVMDQQHIQLQEMLEQSVVDAPHPSLGTQIDIQL